MKKIIISFFLFFCLFVIDAKAFETSATSAILLDQDSGKIIYAKEVHKVRSVASISKIMTAIIAIESGKLDDIVTIGDEINTSFGSGIYIKKDEKIKLKDLLYGLMLRSGNDAALAIANYVEGSVDNFVVKMNEKAKEIGMKNSTFNNPSGLDGNNIKGNYSTAYDMAILTSYAMKNDIYKDIVKTKKYNLKTNMNTYSWINKNKLLTSYKYTTGGKTGFTEIAKRTLVTTATKDDINLIAVTLNDGNDWQDHISLYKEAFETYKKYKILKTGNIYIIEDKYYKDYNLKIKNDFSYILKETEKDDIIIKFELDKNGKHKETVGKLKVMLYDQVLHEDNIYLENKIIKKTFFRKIIDWFKKI